VQAMKACLPIDVTLLGILTDTRDVQLLNAYAGMDVTDVGMITTAWQGNVNAVGAREGTKEGSREGAIDGLVEGAIDGKIDGKTEGARDGTKEGVMDMVGAMDMVGDEVGVDEGGPEIHVDRPVPPQAGYTQAGVK